MNSSSQFISATNSNKIYTNPFIDNYKNIVNLNMLIHIFVLLLSFLSIDSGQGVHFSQINKKVFPYGKHIIGETLGSLVVGPGRLQGSLEIYRENTENL